MNKTIATDLEYESFGKLFVLDEVKYFKDILCNCWCECNTFVKVKKEDLLSGKRLNCGSEENHKFRSKKTKKIRDYTNNRIKARYKLLLHNRKKGKYTIDLTLSEYTELANCKECHYCDAPIDWLGKSSAYYLDRKDNTIGYSSDNCVVCCPRCNMAKGNRFTYNQWCKLGKIIKEWK